MKPDDNYGRKCYADDTDISKDRLLGMVPSFMKAENKTNNLYCLFKELSYKFFNHANIKGRLDLYPSSLIKRFEDKISGLADEFEKVVAKQCEETKRKLLEAYLQFSTDIDKLVQGTLGETAKTKVAQETFERTIKPLLEKTEARRNDYFKTMNNDYVEGLLRELATAGAQSTVPCTETLANSHLESTTSTVEYKLFKYKSQGKPVISQPQPEMNEGPALEDEEVRQFNQQQAHPADNDDDGEALLKATIEVNEDLGIQGLGKCEYITNVDIINTDIITLLGYCDNRVDVSLTDKKVIKSTACSWRTCKHCKDDDGSHM